MKEKIEVIISEKRDLSDYLVVGLEKVLFRKLLEGEPSIELVSKKRSENNDKTTLFWDMAQLAFPAFLRERIITFELRSCINSLLNDANDVLLEKLSHEDFFNRWFIKLPTSGDPYGDTKEAERSVQLMLDRITKMVA